MSGTDLLELSVERIIKAAPEKVYQTWLDRFEDWWAPKPWTTKILARDLRPGGASKLRMQGPDGQASEMEGVFLEVIPNRKIVLTNAFAADWIPQAPFMVALFTFEPHAEGTLYRGASRHWTEETHKQHQAMGFEAGWALVAGQLAALAEQD